MADYTDLPEEISREILLTQSPANIMHHCNVNKNTYKICGNNLFWLDYFKDMRGYEIEKFVLDHIRQSQYFIIPIYEVADKLISDINKKNNLPDIDNITEDILFYSIMRNDAAALKYLLPRNYNINLSAIRRNCNKIIDIINSGHADAKEIGQLYGNILNKLAWPEIPIASVLDQCKKGAINRLPVVFMSDNEEDTSIEDYQAFIVEVIQILAEDVDIKALMSIIQKAYDNKFPLKKLYNIIATSLPTSAYTYVESILPERVNLGKHIARVKDLDHARFLMRHMGFIKLQHMIDLTRFIEPDEFVKEMYYATRRSPKGDELVNRVIARNTPRSADEVGNVKWAREVEKKWEEIKNKPRKRSE